MLQGRKWDTTSPNDSQMININLNPSGTNQQRIPPLIMHREEHNLISIRVLPKVQNLNLIMRSIR